MNATLTSPVKSSPTQFDSILNTVGNTPLIHLKQLSALTGIDVYGKLEMANPGGSIKDRTSLSIIEEGIKNGDITPSTTLIESSSGNMAIGLAQVCRYYNIPLIIVVDPKANKHTLKILNAYGVKVDIVEKPNDDGGYLGARLDRVQELVDTLDNAVWTNQYGNRANPKAHYVTMSEIASSLPDADYVFSATSTCGTLMGCASYIEEKNLSTKLIAVDAQGSVIFGNKPKERFMECVTGCKKLLETESILAGGSSGAVTTAFLKRVPELPKNSKCVLILCDRGERYLETIYNEEWVAKKLK